MNKTLSAARQVTFDIGLVKQIKQLESLASPGSYATFQGDEQSLTVFFHNGKLGEIETRRRFDLPCPAPFEFTIAGKEIMDILKCFDEVTVTVKESSLSFKSGHAKMNRHFSTGVPEHSFPDFSKVSMAPLPLTTFRDAAFAAYAAAADGDNDAAQRISIMLKDQEMSIIASNGMMAVTVVSPSEYEDEAKEYLLHPRFINPLAPLTMKEGAPLVYIGCTDNKYCLRFGEIEITSRIPVASSVRAQVNKSMSDMRERSAMVVTVPTNVIATFLERAKLLEPGVAQSPPVVIKVNTDDKVVYAKRASALGDMQDMFDVELEGNLMPDITMGFSHRLMTEAFTRIRCNEAKLSIRGPLQPVIVTEELDETVITHILLPVRPMTRADNAEKPKPAASPTDNFIDNVSPSDFV